MGLVAINRVTAAEAGARTLGGPPAGVWRSVHVENKDKSGRFRWYNDYVLPMPTAAAL